MSDITFNFVGPEPLAGVNATAKLDIVFVHGLGGDPTDTWAATKTPDDFWPRWLAQDFPDANVWSIGYASSALKSGGSPGWSIRNRAQSLLDMLVSHDIGKRPILFITHSLGGLLVKQMLRKCHDAVNSEHQSLLQQTKGIVFCGTPHQGTELAKAISNIFAQLASPHVKQLSENDEFLLDLHDLFQKLHAKIKFRVSAYVETKKVGGVVMVVSAATANPLIADCDVTPVNGDHFGVCKPDTHEHPLYLSIKHLIQNILDHDTVVSAAPSSGVTTTALTLGDTKGTSLIPAPTTSKALVPIANTLGSHEIAEILHLPEAVVKAYSTTLPEIYSDYEYFTTSAPGDRRTLSEKLEAADRQIEIKDAERQKERFAKALFKTASQPSSLVRYTKLMAEIETRFKRQVRPLVAAKAGELMINKAVQTEIIEPVLKSQEAQTDDITSAVIESALYYLTGNCHVRWDPE